MKFTRIDKKRFNTFYNDEINDYIDKIEFLYKENDDEDFNFLKNQDLLEIDEMWSNHWKSFKWCFPNKLK